MIPYWDFMGSTIITNDYIRLTPDLQSKQGAIWNVVVIHYFLILIKLLAYFIISKYVNILYI